MKRIIDRFRGREGQSETDRRWTAKVSDVRQYFVFSASERWTRRRYRVRALHRLRRQVRRPERKARLHRARRQPRLPVRPRMGRGEVAELPLRHDRRGLRPRLRRIRPLRPRAVQATQPPASRHHPPAEDPHHRALSSPRWASSTTRTAGIPSCATSASQEYRAERERRRAGSAREAPGAESVGTGPGRVCADIGTASANGTGRATCIHSRRLPAFPAPVENKRPRFRRARRNVSTRRGPG